MTYTEDDIQTACNIATGDDETTGKEVIRILKIITEEENSANFRTQVKNNNIHNNLSILFNELGEILVMEDDSDLDDNMQRIAQIKLEISDLIDDYNIKEN